MVRRKKSFKRQKSRKSQKSRKKSFKQGNQKGGGIISAYKIYGRNSCPFTTGAVSLLGSLNKNHTFFDIENNNDNKVKLTNLKKSGVVPKSWNTVPVILLKNKFIGGMDDLQRKLKK